MIKLLTFWAAIRLVRAFVPLIVIASLALLLLGGASRTSSQGRGWVGRLQHAARPLEHQLEHGLQNAFTP